MHYKACERQNVLLGQHIVPLEEHIGRGSNVVTDPWIHRQGNIPRNSRWGFQVNGGL
jgi:hypothetical protein